MSPGASEAAVQRVLGAFAAGDADAAAAALHPDVRIHEVPGLRFGGEHVGRWPPVAGFISSSSPRPGISVSARTSRRTSPG